MPALSISGLENFSGTVTMSVIASLQGIAPLWGTFQLEYEGEKTSPIYVDSDAGEMNVKDEFSFWIERVRVF